MCRKKFLLQNLKSKGGSSKVELLEEDGICQYPWWELNQGGKAFWSHRWDAVQTQLEKYKYTEKERRQRGGRLVSSSCPDFWPVPSFGQTYSGMQQQRSLGNVVLWDTEQSTEKQEIHNTQHNFRFVLTRDHSSTICYLSSFRNARLFLGPHRHFSMELHFRYFLWHILFKEFMLSI